MRRLRNGLLHVENAVHHQLVQHSITLLRVALGAVFLAFGVLKYFPGISPAPASPASPGSPLDGEQRLRLVLDGDGDPRRARELSEQLGISEADLDDWHHVARQAAARALDEHAEHASRNGHYRDDGYPRDLLHRHRRHQRRRETRGERCARR